MAGGSVAQRWLEETATWNLCAMRFTPALARTTSDEDAGCVVFVGGVSSPVEVDPKILSSRGCTDRFPYPL